MEYTHNMKMTPVGLIPEDWDVATIKDFGHLLSDGINPQQYREEDFVEYSMPAYDDGQSPTKCKGADMNSNRTQIKGEVLLFNKLNVRQKRVWYIENAPSNALCSMEFLAYSSDKVDLRLLREILLQDSVTKGFESVSRGTSNSQKRIAPSDFLNFSFALPPLAEQHRIADALSGLDDMIRALDEAIAKKRQIKEGLMQQLLTGTTRLPGFSGEWKTVYLGDLGDFSQGNGFPVQYQGKKSGDYPFYKVSDFNNVGNELYMCMANNYINKDVASILSCKIIPHGSIFMAKIGAAIFLERKRLTTIPCCIDNNTMAFIPNEKLFDSLFALYLFQRIHVGDYAEATALPAINLSNLKKHEVYIPSTLNEQKAIAHVLQSGETDILALESLRGKYDSIKQGMMQELLTGKTRLL